MIRTNYIKAKIDDTQNSKCSLCRNRNLTVNHIVNECSKKVPKDMEKRLVEL